MEAPALAFLFVELLLPLYAGIDEVFEYDPRTRRVEDLVVEGFVREVDKVEELDDVFPPALLDAAVDDAELRPKRELLLERAAALVRDEELLLLLREEAVGLEAEIKARLIFLMVDRKFSSSTL